MEATITRTNVVPGMYRQTSQLIDRLKTGKPGDVASDSDLESICGHAVAPGERGYGYLQSAIRYCRKHHSVYWKRIPKSGVLKCLDSAECLSDMQRDRKAIHKRTGRMIVTGKIAEPGITTDQDKASHRTLLAQAAMLHECSGHQATKAIEATKATGSKVDLGKLLEAMK